MARDRAGGAVPTINDVARLAGVSRGTVSRALNGGHNVSPAAAAAVERAVRSSGYVVNQTARSLVTRRTNCFAFVFSEPQELLFEDPNIATLLRATTEQLAQMQQTLVLMICASPADHARVTDYLRAGHVDGAMLVSTDSGDTLVPAVAASGIPAVLCGFPAAPGMPSVAADDRGGARLMTSHLRDRGRRRIGLVTGPPRAPGSAERREGWADVLGSSARRRDTEAATDYSHRAGYEAAGRLLDRVPDTDAVFAASDLLASGVIDAIADRGRRVPEDIAVGGFDDSRIARSTRPALSTVRQPLDRIGHEMARLVHRLADGEPPVSVVLPVELVVRDST